MSVFFRQRNASSGEGRTPRSTSAGVRWPDARALADPRRSADVPYRSPGTVRYSDSCGFFTPNPPTNLPRLWYSV